MALKLKQVSLGQWASIAGLLRSSVLTYVPEVAVENAIVTSTWACRTDQMVKAREQALDAASVGWTELRLLVQLT